jgi:hypothetical protein
MLGLALPQLLRAASPSAASADACIILFLNGGPSHLDMWDMKPDAPAEVRGEFKPIPTTAAGIQLSEHLARLARQMHRAALVRSVHHSVNNAHAAAVYTGLTGHDRGDANVAVGARPTDHPSIGSVVGQVRPPHGAVVPYVSMPYITQEGRGGPPQPGFFGGIMGRACDPLFVLRDPNAADFAMPELTPAAGIDLPRLDERRRLIDSLAHRTAKGDLDAFQQRAFDLLTSHATRQAFRLDREPLRIRDAYGRNIYGQSVLLARRLIEAGTRVACISWAPDANATWDTHGGNFVKLRKELLPQLDLAASALLEDLHQRGLLQRTLVAIMGEFGRTPKINNNNGGRDHWNFCYTLLLAGGGLKKGFVFGSSDRIGSRPSNNPVRPADIIATIYHCLGISKDHELYDRLARPIQLVPWGDPIPDLLA